MEHSIILWLFVASLVFAGLALANAVMFELRRGWWL